MADTNQRILACSNCGTPLPGNVFNIEGNVACVGCNAPTRALVFPSLFAERAPVSTGEQLVLDGEASCFYHSEKRAAIACERCGRFLCALCDVELGSEHVCPRCIETGVQKDKMTHLKRQHTLYDNVALALALVPAIPFFWFFGWVMAPIAIFVAIRYWNRPLSILRRSRWRFVVAIVAALGHFVAWGIVITQIVKSLGS